MAIPTILICEYCRKSYLPKIKRYPPGRFCSTSCSRRATVAKAKPAASVDDLGHLILRLCKVCKLSKPLLSIYFAPHPKGRHGWKHTCKVCHSKQKSRYNKARRVENNQTQRAWRKANPQSWREMNNRRRARQQQAPRIEKIDREAIYLRDRWICQLCFTKVNKKLRWPDPLSKTLDHVIPLAKGGDHTYQNLVLVHSQCNARKCDRSVQQQMRLFG